MRAALARAGVDGVARGDARRDLRRLLARLRLERRVDAGVERRPEPAEHLLVLPSLRDVLAAAVCPRARKNRSAPREPTKFAKLSLNTAPPGA